MKQRVMAFALLALAGAFGGCGDDEAGTTGTGGSGTGGSGTGGSGTGGSGTAGGENAFAKVGEACGGEEGRKCEPDEFSFCGPAQPFACADATTEGRCETHQPSCGENPGGPVCGCDGKRYENRCVVRDAEIGGEGSPRSCAPEGKFLCGRTADGSGDLYCTTGSELCVVTIGVFDSPDTYACVPECSSCACAACPDVGATNAGCVEDEGAAIVRCDPVN